MSFDGSMGYHLYLLTFVSIPFDQGNVFRPIGEFYVWNQQRVSIPFDQGNVFRHLWQFRHNFIYMSLNPFRSGQCLSTYDYCKRSSCFVSIPFDQGNVFRHSNENFKINLSCLNPFRSGQCLSTFRSIKPWLTMSLNPFRSGQCLSTNQVD